MAGSVKLCVYWSVAIAALLSTLVTTFNLTWFLSAQPDLHNESSQAVLIAYSNSCQGPFLYPLLWNLILIFLFCCQHSLMASSQWKAFLDSLGLSPLTNAIYSLATSFTLAYFMRHSSLLCGPTLWQMNTSDRFIPWLFFFLFHSILWFIIYVSAYCMDFMDLVGWSAIRRELEENAGDVRQVMTPRTKLLRHMRHSGVGCFLLILWVHPLMSIERFLFSSALTLYVLFGHKVTERDHVFVMGQADNEWRDLILPPNTATH
jgi:hypothetical protein